MKGIVFVELLKMAEDLLGEDRVDAAIAAAALPSGGAYTSVGNYPCAELTALVQGFSASSGVDQAELQRVFGHWMMKVFAAHYPDFFRTNPDALSMLQSIESEIHVEVQKLYPESELPRFDARRTAPDRLELDYSSPRPLAPFCHGLIEGCLAHYGTTADIQAKDRSDADLTRRDFVIQVCGPA